MWSENSVTVFQEALTSPSVIAKISDFMLKGHFTSKIDINEASVKLTNIFIEAAEQSLKKTPKYRKNKKKHKNFFDSDLHSMRKNLINYGKIYSSNPKDPMVKNHYYKLYREYNKCRKNKKKVFKADILEQLETLHEDNPKLYWGLINKLQDKNHDSSVNNISPSDWLHHFQDLNKINDNFLDRVKHLEESLESAEISPKCFNELDFVITDNEIITAISKLKWNKSPGLDNITNNMIKCSQSILVGCFKKIFNSCLSNGIYPEKWAEGYIAPLHKANDILDPNNYRGLTITSSIGKLFNSILNSRLDKFLVEHKIIDGCQIGFTKKARTSDHMFVIKTIIDKYCNNPGGRLYACFVDFKKAFDTVIHTGIKLKLLDIGVGSSFYNIIKSMYEVSKSCVKVNENLTNSFSTHLGVKQGDNLSPNLFKIFINNLTNYLKHSEDPVSINDQDLHCLMYADDIVLLSTSPNGLQKKLDILQNYCNDWCLSVNTNKTKVLIFNKAGRLINKYDFMLNGIKLECVNSYKYLGIHFCASGSFTVAQDELYKKALKAYFKLSKDFLSLHPSVKTSMHVFDHTIKPILLYSCEIWGAFNPMSSKYRNGIFSFDHIYSKLPAEKLHTKFCKFILGAPKKSTNFAVLTELGRLPIYFNMIKAVTKYYYRLEKSDTNCPLLYNAFIESKKLYESDSVKETVVVYVI